MGRKPFPLRGTNFAQERSKFKGNRRKIQAAATWWEEPQKESFRDLEIRMVEIERNLATATQEYRIAMDDFSRMRSGRLYQFSSKEDAIASTVDDVGRFIDSEGKVYYQELYMDKAGTQVVVFRGDRQGNFPDVVTVAADSWYGRRTTTVVYRKKYLQFIAEHNEWERRIDCLLDPRTHSKTRRPAYYNAIDSWEQRLKLVVEASCYGL